LPNSSGSGSHDNISKAPKNFFGALLILSFCGIVVSSDMPQFHQLAFRSSVNIVPAKNGLAGGCAVTGYI
ncbi:hypothetical protein ACE45P_005232, partial [Escherichia coli]